MLEAQENKRPFGPLSGMLPHKLHPSPNYLYLKELMMNSWPFLSRTKGSGQTSGNWGKRRENLKLPAHEHAALTQVCLGILNLDQSLTRE